MPFHFFIIIGSLYRGGEGVVWEFFLQGKTPIFLFTLLFSVYICDPNLCPYMLQTPFNSTVFTEQSSSYLLTFVCITEDESMGDLVTYSV